MEQIDKASCGNWDGAKDDGNGEGREQGGEQGAALIEPAPGEGNNKMQPEASNVSSKKKKGWKEAKTSSEQIAQAELSPKRASPPMAETFIQFITIYHYFASPLATSCFSSHFLVVSSEMLSRASQAKLQQCCTVHFTNWQEMIYRQADLQLEAALEFVGRDWDEIA